MEIVEVYFQLGHTSTLKSGGIPIWKLYCSFKITLIFQYLHNVLVEAYFSGDIHPLKKVEALLYGNCGGTFSVRA